MPRRLGCKAEEALNEHIHALQQPGTLKGVQLVQLVMQRTQDREVLNGKARVEAPRVGVGAFSSLLSFCLPAKRVLPLSIRYAETATFIFEAHALCCDRSAQSFSSAHSG